MDNNTKSKILTDDQQQWVCSQIDHWYNVCRGSFQGEHRLGHHKEILKNRLCQNSYYPKSYYEFIDEATEEALKELSL